MNTILNIKTEKALKEQAQMLAKDMGIPLTTVINSYLKQFIRERKFTLDIDPPVNQALIKEWEVSSLDYRKGKNVSKATNTKEELFKDLGI